jgi:hypothetical protein
MERNVMVHVKVERSIAAPADRVFGWLADPVNLTTAPLILRCGFVAPSTPGVGAIREAIAVGMWLREEITAYDPPRSYSYRIVRSFPAFDHEDGTVTCEAGRDDTRVRWATTYTHPVFAGGKVLEAITAPLIRSSFGAILAACARALDDHGGYR